MDSRQTQAQFVMAEKRIEDEGGKSPGELLREEVHIMTMVYDEEKFSRQRRDILRAPIKLEITLGKIKENKIWRLQEDDWRFSIFTSYEDRRAQETLCGRVRIFLRDNVCCWVVPSETSCWNHPMATRSIPSTSSGTIPSTSTWNGAAEEMADEKEVGYSDGENGCKAFWICIKECFLCCFTPSSCCVNALAHRQESISSIALPDTCSTPSTSGRAIIKVVESSMEDDKEESDEDDEEEKIVWYDCLTGLERAPDTLDRRLTERNMEDFGMKNGRVVEEGLEEIDLNVGKLPEFAAGDKMGETEKKKGKGKPKKAGRMKRIRQFFKRLCCCCGASLIVMEQRHTYTFRGNNYLQGSYLQILQRKPDLWSYLDVFEQDDRGATGGKLLGK